MATSPGSGARSRRVLVIANETCAARGVVEEVRYRGGPRAEVMVVAPALARSRLEHWLTSDLERRRLQALERLDASVTAFKAAGLRAQGALGDADPLQALDDAIRTFDPDEVVISTHPPQRSNWLERQVVRRARERYALPITHVVVDLELEAASASRGDAPAAPAPAPAAEPAGEPVRRLRVYHASDYEGALAIRESGFRDAAEGTRSGVWVTDRPPDAGDGGDRVLFAVDLPEAAAAAYEQAGTGGRRMFLMPAELLNRHGPPVVEGDWSE
jgi:hypothetical protein